MATPNNDNLAADVTPAARQSCIAAADDGCWTDSFIYGLIEFTNLTSRCDTSNWKQCTELRFIQKCPREELAQTFRLSIGGVKSMLLTIRKATEKYLASGVIVFPATATVPLSRASQQLWKPAREIDKSFIESCGEQDEVSLETVELNHQLALESRLQLFSPQISGQLTGLLERSDDLGITNDKTAVDVILKEADVLKKRVARDDPFEGRAIFVDIGSDERTNTKPLGRQPKKTKLETKEPEQEMRDRRFNNPIVGTMAIPSGIDLEHNV